LTDYSTAPAFCLIGFLVAIRQLDAALNPSQDHSMCAIAFSKLAIRCERQSHRGNAPAAEETRPTEWRRIVDVTSGLVPHRPTRAPSHGL
jgi:hypothetical protein